MAVLSAAQRNKLPKSSFALPAKDGYPVNDLSHARNALARVSQFGTSQEKATVRSTVRAKFPRIRQGK